MNLRTGSTTKSPAPGVQQQQQAEAMSRQRAQAQQAVQMQAQGAMAGIQMNPYHQQTPVQNPNIYGGLYTPNHQAAPPPYPTQNAYSQQMGMMQPAPQMHAPHFAQQPNLHAQATARAVRQRASTMDQQQSGIPPALQRVVSHLDPNQPIRLQPSPAYYPPPADGMDMTPGGSRRRTSRAGQGRSNRDFIRTLEDRSVEDTYMMGTGTQPWH